jgi:hypothetical protein
MRRPAPAGSPWACANLRPVGLLLLLLLLLPAPHAQQQQQQQQQQQRYDGECLIPGPTPEHSPVRLPLRQGGDVCKVMREHCGPGRQGAMCLKSALERILRSDTYMEAIRTHMDVPPDMLFLCAGVPALPGLKLNGRVAALTQLLGRASTSAPAPGQSDDEYREVCTYSIYIWCCTAWHHI